MKPTFILLLLCFFHSSYSQEFETNSNGLIYSDYTMGRLKYIVDSLNLKFRHCDLSRTYYSQMQGKTTYVEVSQNVPQALADMKNGISLNAFIQKYPGAKVTKDLLVMRQAYKNYDNKDVVMFFSLELSRNFPDHEVPEEEANFLPLPKQGNWIPDHHDKTKYSPESLDAFFVEEDFAAKPLPDTYARMVQYSDCMIDTTTQVYLVSANAYNRWSGYTPRKEPVALVAFENYVDTLTHRPFYMGDGDYNAYRKKEHIWDSTHFIVLDKKIHEEPLARLFKRALDSALKAGDTNDEFEDYVERYVSPATALQLKRSRMVMGMCSQDDRPRLHALNIAKLSAEAVSWDVFLRAHLDIMNDRFERMSDGSYAWGKRQTYIKEIETLDIDVIDLLLGISVRVENASKNHYFGSIDRIGRSLAESKDPDLVEAKLQATIQDHSLDDYNRVLMLFLYSHYTYNLKDEQRKAKNKEVMKKLVATFPEYLSSKIRM